MNVQARYDNFTVRPHCISRGFKNTETDVVGSLSGHDFRPEAMENLMAMGNFTAFAEAIEGEIHVSIHNGINGDFGSLTSANGT